MTVFPKYIYQREIPMNKLDELPNSITRGLNPQMSLVTYEGLSTQLGEAQTPNDLLLPIYQSSNDSGMNFGVMFFNHDHFNDRYEINPHKVNFKKDRDTFCVGNTNYTANIRKYVKDVKTTYTLKHLVKGVSSPLFVPYVDDVYLVLEPIQDNQSDNPPLLLDEDEPPKDGGGSIGTFENFLTKEYVEERDEYYEPMESLMDSFPEDDYRDLSLEKLFEPSPLIHTVLTKEETEAQAFYEVDGQKQQSLIMFDEKNDPVKQAQKDFMKMFPNAGKNMDTFDYEGHGMIPPTQEIHIDSIDQDQTSLDDFNMIIVPAGKTSDNMLRYGYEIEDDTEMIEESVFIAYEEIDGEYLTKLQLPPKHEYQSLKLGDEDKMSLRDIPVELTDDDTEVNIFDTPNLKMKPIDNRKYDEYTEIWRRDYGKCTWVMPMPKEMSEHHKAGSDDWIYWARFSCQCEGSKVWHDLNDTDSRGVELTDKALEMIDSRDIFHIKPEPPEETGKELKKWEWNYDIFKTPQPTSLVDQLVTHKRNLREAELSDLSNLMEEYADKNFNHHRHFKEPIVNIKESELISNYKRSIPSSKANMKNDDYISTPKKFNFKRVDNYHHISDNIKPVVAIKPTIDGHVPLYIRKVI